MRRWLRKCRAMHRIELDSVRKYRNAREWHEVPRARCNGLEIVGYGKIIRQLCASLAEQGADLEGLVEVYRGDTLCFAKVPLKRWFCAGREESE